MCKVSEIGGGWTVLLKGALATYPLMLAWGGWVTIGLVELKSFRSAGDRFTPTDANQMYRDIDERLDRMPDAASLIQIEREIRETKDLLQQFEREFSANFVRKDELNK